MTRGITKLSMTALNITTFNILNCDTRPNKFYSLNSFAKCRYAASRYAEHNYAECRGVAFRLGNLLKRANLFAIFLHYGNTYKKT